MKQSIRLGALLASLLFALSCASSQDPIQRGPRQVRLGKEFELRPGQQSILENDRLTITFVKVLSDSRCPAEVNCIREGNAQVELAVRVSGEQPDRIILDTARRLGRQKVVGLYRIELTELLPYPGANRPIRPSDYGAMLLVTHE